MGLTLTTNARFPHLRSSLLTRTNCSLFHTETHGSSVVTLSTPTRAARESTTGEDSEGAGEKRPSSQLADLGDSDDDAPIVMKRRRGIFAICLLLVLSLSLLPFLAAPISFVVASFVHSVHQTTALACMRPCACVLAYTHECLRVRVPCSTWLHHTFPLWPRFSHLAVNDIAQEFPDSLVLFSLIRITHMRRLQVADSKRGPRYQEEREHGGLCRRQEGEDGGGENGGEEG